MYTSAAIPTSSSAPRALQPHGPLGLLLSVLLIACGGNADPGGHLVTRQEVGDVTLVRNVRGSRWGEPARLEEGLRLDGAGGVAFGAVGRVWLSPERILVVDGAVAVRAFDRSGAHLGDLDGAEAPGDVVVLDDGRVLVRDGFGPQRLRVLSPEGDHIDTWEIEERLGTAVPMVLTEGGRLYAQRLLDRSAPNDAARYGMVEIGAGGVVGEPLRFPDSDYRPLRLEVSPRLSVRVPYDPRAVFAMSPSGALIAGLSYRYRITVQHPDGRATVIERNWSSFEIPDGERDWEARRLVAFNRRLVPDWSWDGAEIPLRKPAYREIVPDRSRRLWVIRDGESVRVDDCTEDPAAVDPDEVVPCWRSETLVDVFDEAGDYLGEVEVPSGVRLDATAFIEDDLVLAAVDDPAAGTHVVLFRLVRSRP